MNGMFYNAALFNRDIYSWDTSNVTNMINMFNGAQSFNQDLSKWKTGNVTSMYGMFYNASSFNQNISSWNVDKVSEHDYFSTGSGIINNDKLPKFNH